LLAQGAEIGGAVLLRAVGAQRFEVEGCVFLLGARIGGNLELTGAKLEHGDDYALSLQTARIDGQLYVFGNTIEGAVILAGARIGRLFDNPDTAWGEAKAKTRIETNEISLDLIGAHDGASTPLWRARARWLRRNTGEVAGGWPKPNFSNQPWRQVAAAFERAGLHQDARRIRREEQREANRFRAFWKRPFVWLVAEQMFGFGLSVSRATVTALVFWIVGACGAWFAQERGALVAAQAPHMAERVCEEFQPGLYAFDVMVPVLDLGQERACEPGRAPGKDLGKGIALGFNGWALFEEIAVWNWAKALYAVFGAAIIGFALLTYTGVFKPRADP
jgi:hypothetical protein